MFIVMYAYLKKKTVWLGIVKSSNSPKTKQIFSVELGKIYSGIHNVNKPINFFPH